MTRTKEEHRKQERERYRKKNNVTKYYALKDDKESYEKVNGKGSWTLHVYNKTKERAKELSRERRNLIFEKYGNKCVCCGETEHKFLTIDHINNDGAKHRREISNNKHRGGNLDCWIIRNNFPDFLQILCYNCNCSKGNWGTCPHQDSML